MLWNDNAVVDAYRNPSETSFADWRNELHDISDEVYKKTLKQAEADATEVDLER